MIKLMLCYFVISVVYLFFNDYLLTFLRHQRYLFVSLFMLYVFCAAGAGRNLVNYRSRNRPETHALPA
jgi:multisubunit Na+/H+ antiporter MnhB subunit